MTNDLSIPKALSQLTDGKSVGGRFSALPVMISDMSKGAQHKAIGDRLKVAMIWAGFDSAAGLARALGEEESRVRNWVNGHGRPKVDEALRLKPLLRITLDWLYDGDPSGLPQGTYAKLISRSSPPSASGDAQEAEKGTKSRAAACVVAIARRVGKSV